MIAIRNLASRVARTPLHPQWLLGRRSIPAGITTASGAILDDAPFDFQCYTEFGLRRDMERAGLNILTFRKSDRAIRSAGLLMCLAIAGGAHAQRWWIAWLLLPLTLLAMFVINIIAWLASLLWLDWRHMAKGHELEVRKP